MPKHTFKKDVESTWQLEDSMWNQRSKGKKKQKGLGGHKHIKPPKNCSHKYNISTINFFGNVWTSHLGLFLFVSSIID
jgi:hypothetical protein